jgi:hypothetical protein
MKQPRATAASRGIPGASVFQEDMQVFTPGVPLCRDQYPKLRVPDAEARWRRTYFKTEQDAEGHFDTGPKDAGFDDLAATAGEDLEAAVDVVLHQDDSLDGTGGTGDADARKRPSSPQKSLAAPFTPVRKPSSRKVLPSPLDDPLEDTSHPPAHNRVPRRTPPNAYVPFWKDVYNSLVKPSWAPAGICPCLCPFRPPLLIYRHWDAIVNGSCVLLLLMNVVIKIGVLNVFAARQQVWWATVGSIFFILGALAPLWPFRRYLLLLAQTRGKMWFRRTCTKYEIEDEPSQSGPNPRRIW